MPKNNGTTRRAKKRARKQKGLSLKERRLSRKNIDILARRLSVIITRQDFGKDDIKRYYCSLCKKEYCKLIGINRNIYCKECYYGKGCDKKVITKKDCIICKKRR